MNCRMMIRSIAWSIASAIVSGPASAATIYVSPLGDDINTGLSWAAAKRTVQGGLNVAQAGDQVWVAAGTYVERITLTAGVALYGGLSGNEDPVTFNLANRDFKADPTVLNANQDGCVVTSPQGATLTTRIDGFTIWNELLTATCGIDLSYSSPTIANNALLGCGISCSNSSPTIANNTILRSGITCTYSSPLIINNTIKGSKDGGIYCGDSPAIIVNNTIIANRASSGGGIYCYFSPATIINNIIAFNSTGLLKSGVSSTLTIRYNCVYGNKTNYSGITNPTGTNGNISVDPKLADLDYGNTHLQPNSACKDAGDDSMVQPDWLDMDRQARIQGYHVDIGADESDGTVWSAGPYVIVRVSPDGNNAKDGSTWALAKRTVQGGIMAASSQGGEVWVRGGTYLERIALWPYADLYGGFEGTEETREARNWIANATILDGQKSGSVVTFESGVERGGCIDGFTIRNGMAYYGGGIYCGAVSPTIANNTITENSASTAGGGIHCGYSSTIVNTIITRNSGASGGGICCGSSVKIFNSMILGNGASSGGGIYCGESHSPIIINNTITRNIASTSGGGIYCGSSASPKIINTIVAFNSSGIYQSGSGSWTPSYSCVYGNSAYNYSGIADPTGTNGNISMDPMLADPAYGNAHIQPDSACKDAGNNNAWIQLDWRDVDLQPRFQGLQVDIGADESDGTVWPTGPYAVVHVSPDGNDANDGSTWELAKRTVQDGTRAAASQGGEVWVRAGTYLERVSLLPYVYMYGGFAGTETAREERNWTLNATILDGQQGGSVVTASGGYQISRIDGFTIRNGASLYGGGIYCKFSSPTIANNTITGNNAISPSYSSTYGGGGISCHSASPTIVNNTIINNSASGPQGNTGGGIRCINSSPAIINNTIKDNSVYGSGGGIACSDTSSPVISSVTIANNDISGNSASSRGGGIICYDVPLTINTNTITDNNASSGGGIYCSRSSSTISNNIIARNNASSGGGVYCDSSSKTKMINNTITKNTVSTNEGGGIYCSSSSPTIANTIVAFNTSGFYIAGSGTSTLQNNCIYGNFLYNYSGINNPTGTNGNISLNPGLAGSLPGDEWHIQPDSPCVDAGDDSMVQPDWLDMDGQFRLGGVHVDIGADESDGTDWPNEIHPMAIMVHPDGNDVNNGASWREAKRTVQAGIDTAANLGAEVWVKAGTYRERINLRPGSHVYGGFYGTELRRNDRHWGLFTTILDGQQEGSVVTFVDGDLAAGRIDGFTIRNGSAALGGGIHCVNSTLTIANNILVGNQASEDGGAVYGDRSSTTIVNNALAGNRADSRGAGIFCSGSSSTIANNTIAANTAASWGGGICTIDSTPVIANTIVASNSSGIHIAGLEIPNLSYNCVYGNAGGNYSGWSDPTGTNGNISQDPLFVREASPGPDGEWGTPDDDYGALWLNPESPCIDAGDDGSVPADMADFDDDGNVIEPTPLDLSVNGRFCDDPTIPNSGNGMVDMGAYEHEHDQVTLISAVSRKTHGSYGTYDIDLPLDPSIGTGIESRKDGPTSVVLTFSGPVRTAGVWTSVGTVMGITVDQRQATVQLTGMPKAGCAALTVSTSPGLQGDNDVHIDCLFGDATGDGKVNVLDLLAARNNLNKMVTTKTFRIDIDVNGYFNVMDLISIKGNINKTVSCP